MQIVEDNPPVVGHVGPVVGTALAAVVAAAVVVVVVVVVVVAVAAAPAEAAVVATGQARVARGLRLPGEGGGG